MQFKTERNDLLNTLQLLHTVLANWDTLADVPNIQRGGYSCEVDGYHVVLFRGLCQFFGLLHGFDRENMYECWEDFSGSYIYPVGRFDEYNDKYRFNKFANPQRKYLLTHCISLIEEYLNVSTDE